MQLYQGDIRFEKIEALPEGATKKKRSGRIVVAEGEATGHHHAVADPHVALYERDGVLYLLVSDDPAQVTHEEHAPLTLDPGVWEVGRQCEWSDSNEPMQVLD